MSGNPSQIATALQPDSPLVQNASYRLDANDRQYIDNQILGCQTLLSTLLINGVIATYTTLDSGSAAASVGDIVSLGSSATGFATVTRALTAVLAVSGAAYGIVLTAASPGGRVLVALGGIVPPSITGLASGANGVAKVNGSTARALRAASFSAGDFPLGIVDSAGYLDLNPTYAYPSGAGILPGGTTNQLQTNSGASTFNGVPVTVSAAGVVTNSGDSKLTIATPPGHISTSSTTTTTILTFALAGITGMHIVRALITVTDASATNVAAYQVDAGYKQAAGSILNVYGSTATNLGKAGSFAGTEVTLTASGTSVLVQVTAPSSTAFTWHIHPMTQLGIP